jgi:hypothetical protein
MLQFHRVFTYSESGSLGIAVVKPETFTIVPKDPRIIPPETGVEHWGEEILSVDLDADGREEQIFSSPYPGKPGRNLPGALVILDLSDVAQGKSEQARSNHSLFDIIKCYNFLTKFNRGEIYFSKSG